MRKSFWLLGVSAMALGMAAAPVHAQSSGSASSNVNAQATTVTGNTATDNGSERVNRIVDSYSPFSGILHVQQNNGSSNSINAASAVVADAVGPVVPVGAFSFVNSNTNSNVTNVTDGAADPDRLNVIRDSFIDGDGQLIVQQNNGDNNEIGAGTAVYGAAVDVASINQSSSANGLTAAQTGNGPGGELYDPGSQRANRIVDSFDDSNGTIVVQQNNGSANAMSVASSIAATTGNSGAVTQTATADGAVAGIAVLDEGATRNNRIDGSFDGAAGEISVQENNGDANVMSIGNAVAAAAGDVNGDVTQTNVDGGAENIAGVTATSQNDTRNNAITDSFTGVAGLTTVQQNNGNTNSMTAANSVVGVLGNVNGDVNQTVADAGGSFIAGDVDVDVDGSARNNLINPSFNEFEGVVNVQQNNGDANVMQTSSAFTAVTGTTFDINQAINATGNSVVGVTATDAYDDGNGIASDRSNAIIESFDDGAGHVAVQQNNGSANVMTAAQAVAAGIEGADNASQTVAVSGTAGDSTLYDDGSTRNNRIEDSFNDTQGTSTVQQNNGDGNVMTVATAHIALIDDAPGGNILDDTTQTVTVGGTVFDQPFTDDDDTVAEGPRNNAITGSYNDGTAGVHNVQQNNGNGNVMGTGLGVMVDSSGGGSPGGENVNAQTVAATASVTGNTGDIDGAGGGIERRNVVDGSFEGFSGVTTIQQNGGDNNVMGSAVAVRANVDAGDDIDMVSGATASTMAAVDNNLMADGNAGNQLRNTVTDSFTDAEGVIGAQQNTGNNNAINSATGVVANVDSVAATPTQPAASTAFGTASVTNNTVGVGPNADMRNRIEGSFDGAAGVASVQQNTGHSNAMGASTQVTADDGSLFGPAVSAAALGSNVSGNTTTVVAGTNTFANNISSSFNGAQGVMTVQQNNGSNNVIGSAISVVANF